MIERMVATATVGSNGLVSRRGFLRTVSVGAGIGSLGFHDLLLASAPEMSKKGKSVIVLWMQGGPSQFETFDPKTGSDGCMTGVIQTAAPGIQIADYWPKLAAQMKDVALIRSMTNKEGNHQRATYQLHTGYAPSGTLRHPSFGSLVTSEIAPKAFDLPSFVSVLGPSEGAGFLPVAYNPFRVQDPTRLPNNAQPLVHAERLQKRLNLLSRIDQSYAGAGAAQLVQDHELLYQQAQRMILSPRLKAFDIAEEPETTSSLYGSSPFAKGCLLSRRLVEAGVTYVEVQLGNWDTHQDNKERTGELGRNCDQAFAALIADLKSRGLLDNTLVVWMGEFGRTPRVNPRGGRDHYPRAFSVAVAGCGIKGGQVIGKTNANGTDVAERPVAIPDLFHTFCKCLGIQPDKENQSPVGRPLKIVDGGAVIAELLS